MSPTPSLRAPASRWSSCLYLLEALGWMADLPPVIRLPAPVVDRWVSSIAAQPDEQTAPPSSRRAQSPRRARSMAASCARAWVLISCAWSFASNSISVWARQTWLPSSWVFPARGRRRSRPRAPRRSPPRPLQAAPGASPSHGSARSGPLSPSAAAAAAAAAHWCRDGIPAARRRRPRAAAHPRCATPRRVPPFVDERRGRSRQHLGLLQPFRRSERIQIDIGSGRRQRRHDEGCSEPPPQTPRGTKGRNVLRCESERGFVVATHGRISAGSGNGSLQRLAARPPGRKPIRSCPPPRPPCAPVDGVDDRRAGQQHRSGEDQEQKLELVVGRHPAAADAVKTPAPAAASPRINSTIAAMTTPRTP